MSLYVGLIILAVVSCFVCILLSVINSSSDNSFYLIFLTLAGFIYSFGQLLTVLAPSAEAALVGIRVQYVGLPFIAPIFYLFASSILRGKQLSLKMRGLICLPPVILPLVFLVFRVFNLYNNQVTHVVRPDFGHWELVIGPKQIIHMTYSYIFFFLSLSLMMAYYRSYYKRKRQQIHILLAALLIPVLTNASLGLPGYDAFYDFTPLAVAVSLGLLLYLVRRYNLLKVIPLARTQVIEQMQDALIICDARQHYLDANSAAMALFPHIKKLQPGDPFFADQGLCFLEEMQLMVGSTLRTFKVSQTDIRQGNKNSGVCTLLHDITEMQAIMDELYDRATFDGLMNIFNRASFFDRAEFALRDRSSEFALLMLDIDHFKKVNDRYGHACGDMTLQKLAEVIKGALSENDLIGRFGGEEIVILIENTAAEAALVTAKDLGRLIERIELLHEDQTFHITVSIGVAHSKKGAPHKLETLLAGADEALYNVKNSGRNNSRLYEPLN